MQCGSICVTSAISSIAFAMSILNSPLSTTIGKRRIVAFESLTGINDLAA